MSEDFRVTGADDFLKLSKALKAAGEKDLRKALHKGLQQGAKPLIPLTRAAAAARLPKGGGLATRMSRAPQRVRVRTGKDPKVTLELPGKQPGYNDGVIRHPVFERDKASRKGAKERGDKPAHWVVQHVDGTWFDGTIAENGPAVLPALEAAIEKVAEEVVRKAGR